MAISRLRRFEERRDKRKLLFSIIGSFIILVFLLLFGVKILIGFSLTVDKLRGTAATSQPTQPILLPPTLNPLPEATNSATVDISGLGQAGLTLILYVNEGETKKIPVSDTGTFAISGISLSEGINTVSAKLTDGKGNTSDLSNIISTRLKRTPPSLDITAPADRTTVSGEKNTVLVTGKTEDQAMVTVNGRFALVRTDGIFSYEYSLGDGENVLRITATDPAGNQTTIERRVTYQK